MRNFIRLSTEMTKLRCF